MGSVVSRLIGARSHRVYVFPNLTEAGRDALSHSSNEQKNLVDGKVVHGDRFHDNRQPDYILANLPFNMRDWRRDPQGDDKHWDDSVLAADNTSHLQCADGWTKVLPVHA